MKHDLDDYQAMQRWLARVYGKSGKAKAGIDAWRSTRPLEPTQPMAVRHPIQRRDAFLQRLNGWLQIAIGLMLVALVAGAGFVAGALWELSKA